MLDQILSWMLIILPVAFGFILILVPAKQEDLKRHMRWRYRLGGLLIAFGVLTWIQQSRALKASVSDRSKAIEETSEKVSAKVAADTSASVTKTVTELYSKMISDQDAKISQLQGQLTAQGKDVSTIKGSNFVTGKAPVKVEVTNGTPGAATLQVEDVKLFAENETSTHADAQYAKKITIQSNLPINPIKLAIFCDVNLKYGEGGPTLNGSMYFGGNEIYEKDPKVFIINMTTQGGAILRPDAPLVFHLYSNKPITVLRFERGPR